MTLPSPIDGYLEKALHAEEHARNTTDSELRARWLGIAFGYRELARYRQQASDRIAFVPEQPPASSISPRN